MAVRELDDLSLLANRLDSDPSSALEGRHAAFGKSYRFFTNERNSGLSKLTGPSSKCDGHPVEAFVGVGAILLMSIVLAALIHGARTRSSRLEPGPGMTLVVYFILMYMVFNSGA